MPKQCVCTSIFLPVSTMSDSERASSLPPLDPISDIESDTTSDKLNTEKRVQLAVKAVHQSPLNSNGLPTLSIRAAASQFDVKRGMLQNQLMGVKSKKEAHAHERVLSDAQEDVLVSWAKTLGHRGYPVTHDMISEYATVCHDYKYINIYNTDYWYLYH